MKNHQFAIQPVSDRQILKELTTLHFYQPEYQGYHPNWLFKTLLNRAMVNYRSSALKRSHLRNLMATPRENADSYLSGHAEISGAAFYNLALQLLHFEVHLDFELNAPLEAMRKMNLPFLKLKGMSIRELSNHHLSNRELLHAWYLLLNTHTKLGQTYLDDLASNGYFAWLHELPKPLFINGKAQPIFDTQHLIHEVVYVETPLDTDHDGKRDLVRVDVIRPGETNHGLKVPTLFTASPYNLGTNDRGGKDLTHHVNVPLKHKQPNQRRYVDVESHADPTQHLPAPRKIRGRTKQPEESFHQEWTYTLNDYFLARGFAVVYSAGIGTRGSQGLRTTGSKAETIAAESVIEWLAGNRVAFTNPTDQIAVSAWWSNHRVGMTGRSYLGTLSTAVASTGVPGLKTVIVEAGISNWYDYYRDHGLVVAPGGFQGEDCDVLAEETFSRQKLAGDYHRIKPVWQWQLRRIARGQDRQTGNYNRFWDARNYLKDLPNARANFLIVHGLNDWNVKPRNAANLWQHLRNVPVTKKLILHQGQHIYINNFQSIDFTDMVNLWLSNQLYGVHNHARQLLPNVTVQDNTTPETWHTYPDWGNVTHRLHYRFNRDRLDPKNAGRQPLSFGDALPKAAFDRYCRYHSRWYHDLLTSRPSPMRHNRLILKTVPLKHDLIIDGRARIKVRIQSSRDFGMLSLMLVDYGKARRLTVSPQIIGPQAIYQGYQWRKDDLKEFKFQRHPTLDKKITEGHINLQNRHSSYRVDDLQPNQPVDVALNLQPTFFHVLPGHRIGLVLYATDFAMTTRGNQPVRYTIDPQNSSLVIPIYR